MIHPRLTLALTFMEALAIFAYAISGFIEAKTRRLDAVGTFLVAIATAFGGGTLRDVLLERRDDARWGIVRSEDKVDVNRRPCARNGSELSSQGCRHPTRREAS